MGKPASSPRTSSRPPLVVDYAVNGVVTIAAKIFASLFMSLFFVMRLSARLPGEKPESAKTNKGSDVVCILQERFPGWAVYQSKETFQSSRHTEKRTAAGRGFFL